MKRTLFPGYSVGTDAYEDIKEICPAYGKKAAIIGGKHALAAAQDKIIAAAKEAGIEIIGPFWYGGEASVENIEMLKPKVADADMIFAVGGGKAIHIPDHRLDLRILHEPRHTLSSGRKPARIFVLEDPAQAHFYRHSDNRRRAGQISLGRHRRHDGKAL